MMALIPFFAAIILIIVVLAVSLKMGIWEKYSYSYDKVDFNDYFELTSAEQAPLLFNNEYLNDGAIYSSGDFFIRQDIVKDYLDDNYYYNSDEGRLLYTTGEETIEYTEDKDYIRKNDTYYINRKIVCEYADMYTIEYTDPCRIELFCENVSQDTAVILKNTQCRVRGGIKSEVLTDLIKGDKVYVLSAMDEWAEIKTNDGFIGYVENKKIGDFGKEDVQIEKAPKEISVVHNLYPGKICLGWHQVAGVAANDTIDDVLAASPYMNVISPTWMSLLDDEGTVANIASAEYVNKAHEKGVKVWGLVDNFSPDVTTYNILSSTTKRTNLINQLVQTAVAFGMDGINIDFENLNVEIGPHFSQFIKELSLECHKTGLVLSVDNYVPKDYTDFYNREVQGKFGDYVIIMGYDEHFAGSSEAGSVASFDYVSNGIANTLEQVNASQVINGIPFYTRVWHEGATLESEALGMNAAESYVESMGGKAVWDDNTAQNYAEFKDSDGVNCKVWLEDEMSISAKLNLIQTNNLAGVACWKLGLEKASIWDIIGQYMSN